MRRLLVCLLAILLLSGCEVLPYPRELESAMLVRVLGVDRTAEGIVLTAADSPEDGAGPTLLTGIGASFEESVQRLKEAGESYVSLTHVTQIVMGADVQLRETLEGALAQREVGQSATVWLAEGRAEELLKAVGGGARRLTSLELNTAGLETRTVLEALAEMEERGRTRLPRLCAAEGRLEVAG